MSKSTNVKIVSGGSALTTHVFVNGAEVANVKSVSVGKISAGDLSVVKATIEIIGPELDLVVDELMVDKLEL
jgi:hypothetical protein